jgi:hypothetical protein
VKATSSPEDIEAFDEFNVDFGTTLPASHLSGVDAEYEKLKKQRSQDPGKLKKIFKKYCKLYM